MDPPFFQKESESSNDDNKPYHFLSQAVAPKSTDPQSSSADDYRSVIDDLTVEIQKLKEELKRYKQNGPDMLRKEKLFEIKIHGLPMRKRRELETTLRDFAASLEGSPGASSQEKKSSRHANRDHLHSNSGSLSKHASSSSGSNLRPVDSAYASMSTGARSSGTSLERPSMGGGLSKSSEQKVESYLRDIPEGLYPRHMVMTEKNKKKLVVRRLEQLFTGKMGGRNAHRVQLQGTSALAPVITDTQSQQRPMMHQPPTLLGAEPLREARILPPDHSGQSGMKSRSGDDGSASNSNGDQAESGGNGNSCGSAVNTSPPMLPPPEQRPTRPKDLDPDRTQVPSENMEYIKHLGLVPPELLADATRTMQGVKTDADGWVYLNLLCNLAQLHIINVTPSFVRAAVSEISTKFQLSPDGRKIRWRGGSEGTRFASDSSGDNSQRSPESDDTGGSNKDDQRKRQKTGHSTGDEFQSGTSSKNLSKFGPQVSAPSESFHYKPLFVRQDSSRGETSPDDTLSSFGPVEDSNIEDSRWGLSGSGGTGNRRKRRHDGVIIYYSGAPFCTDLSGDPGDLSPATYMMSSAQDQSFDSTQFARRPASRAESGSLLGYKPLSTNRFLLAGSSKMDIDNNNTVPSLAADSGDESDEVEIDLPWSGEQQFIDVHPLEPCGLGGVLPDDHFMVVVTTKRPKYGFHTTGHHGPRAKSEEATDGIINRLATMTTSSPLPLASRATSRSGTPPIEIEYVSGRIKRLAPVPLPPPAIFYPPFSTDASGDEDEGFGSEDEDDLESSEGFVSRRANQHQSDDYPDGVDLSSGDEDGENPDDEPDTQAMYGGEDSKRKMLSKSATAEMMFRAAGSSVATAGGVASSGSSCAMSS